MKTSIVAVALSLLFMLGCETRTFQYVTTLDRTLEFTVDQEGAFSETYTIYAGDFNDELDLPDDAVVQGVYIEAFSIASQQLPGNEASQVLLDCYGGADEKLFADELAVAVEVSYNYKTMKRLLEDGVNAIRDDLEGFVRTSTPSSIVFRAEGDSYPVAGERIHATIRIGVTITVGYEMESEFLRSG